MASSSSSNSLGDRMSNYDLDDLVRLVEWTSNLQLNKEHLNKSISNHGSDGKNDISGLVGAVNALACKYNQNERKDNSFQHFLDCFYILSAEVLAVPSAHNSNSISYNSVQVKNGCRTIAQYILERIENSKKKHTIDVVDKGKEILEVSIIKSEEASTKIIQTESLLSAHVTNKIFLATISTFCTGVPSLEKADKDAVIESLKMVSDFPEGIIFTSIGKSTADQPAAMKIEKSGSDDTAANRPVASSKGFSVVTTSNTNSNTIRPQTDLTSLLFGQLCSPMEEFMESPGKGSWTSVIPPPVSSEPVLPSNRHLNIVSNIIHPNDQQQIPALNLTTSKSEQSSLMPSPFEAIEAEGLGPEGFRHSSFVDKNIALLHGLNTGDVIMDFCSWLPELSKYISQWDDSTSDEVKCVPTTILEAHVLRQSFKDILNDIDITTKALSLPILEPLTSSRLSRLTKIVIGCLLASVSVTTAQSINELGEVSLSSQQTTNSFNSRKISSQTSGGSTTNVPTSTTHNRKDSQLEGYAIEIVEKSLELFNTVLATIRQSTRAGGHILQNFMMIGDWILVKGLMVQIDNTSLITDKHIITDGKMNSSKSTEDECLSIASSTISAQPKKNNYQDFIDLSKAKPGFSVLSVALGSQALTLTSMLVEDLSSEVKVLDDRSPSEKIQSANLFDLFHPFTATERVSLILQSVPFIQLLFQVAMISYSKAGDLVKISTFSKTTEAVPSPQTVRQLNNALKNLPVSTSKTSDYSNTSKISTKKSKLTKDQPDRSRNRRGGRVLRATQRRVIEDESTGDDDEDDDEDDSDDDDTDENEIPRNRNEPSDESENEDDEDNDDEDEDSEPLLGKWFEETLFPPEDETNINRDSKNSDVEENNGFSLGSKSNNPDGFISLASHIFTFLNKHILMNESHFVKNCIRAGLTETQMFIISDIVLDLDSLKWIRESYQNELFNKGSVVYGNMNQKDRMNNNGIKTKSTDAEILGSLYDEFSTKLAIFTHNLLAYGLLTPKLQNSLLARLSVSPWQENISEIDEGQYLSRQSTSEWPLRVNSRTLAILGQILLLRQNSMDDNVNISREPPVGSLYPPVNRQTNTYVVIWEKVLSKLTKCIIDDKISKEEIDQEDLNVEHAQLLLFTFHALGLMQKKQVLIFAGNCLIKVAGIVKSQNWTRLENSKHLRTNQVFYVSRLILLFEYIMTHLYEPTKQLLEQVQSNIFKKQTLHPSSNFITPSNLKYHGFSKIEDNLARYNRKIEYDTPRFYNLFVPSADNSVGHQGLEEGPITANKLDGLACSFVLGTPDALQYGQLYQSLIDILHIVHQTCPVREDTLNLNASNQPSTVSAKNAEMEKIEHLAAIQYCFSLTWRLLQSMPPSVEFLEHLIATKEMPEKVKNVNTLSEKMTNVEQSRDVNDKKEAFEQLDTCSMLHSLLILPRVEQKVFATWVKDCLVKQGQTTANAEELVKKSKTFNTFAYDVGCMKNLLQSLVSRENLQGKGRTFVSAKRTTLLPIGDMPHFFDLLALDATMAKVQISLDRMFSGVDSNSGSKSATASTREQVAASAVERLLGVTEQLADAVDAAHDLVPLILQLVEAFSVCAKSLVVHSACVRKDHTELENACDDDETVIEGEIVKTYKNGVVLDDFKVDESIDEQILTPQILKCLAVSGNRCQHTIDISQRFNSFFPAPLRSAVASWNETSLLGFPPISSWRSSSGQQETFSSNDVGGNQQSSPFEAYISSVVHTHIATLSSSPPESLINTYHAKSLKHCLYSAARFAGDLFVWYPESSHLQNDLVWVLFPLILDGCAENLSDLVSLTLERLIGVHDSDEFLAKVYQHVLANLYGGILSGSGSSCAQNKKSQLEKKILHEVLRFMEAMLDKPIGRHTLDAFFSESPEHSLVQVLLSIAPSVEPTSNDPEHGLSSQSKEYAPSSAYTSQVLSFFNKLFVSAEKYPEEPSTKRLCGSLAKLSDIPQNELENWLRYLVSGIYQQQKVAKTLEEKTVLQENIQLLQALTNYIVSDSNPVPEEVALTILNTLLSKNIGSELLLPTSEGMPFSDLMVVLTTLANAESGVGHVQLFRACTEWMATCRNFIVQKNVIEKLEKVTDISFEHKATNETNSPQHKPGHMVMVENACTLLGYMSDVVYALKYSTSEETKRAPDSSESIGNESEANTLLPYDWMDEGSYKDDIGGIGICGEDSAAEDDGVTGVQEDSDDEGSSLDNRLCTFTQTQKEFMNQHWYHCHTCRMVDGVGVCAICAKVCHAGHDVTYSKHGSFFCDCGAKEDGSCIAMVKRTPGTMGLNIEEAHTSYGMLAIAPRRQEVERRQSQNIHSSGVVPGHSEPSENTAAVLPSSLPIIGSYGQDNAPGNLRRNLGVAGTYHSQCTTTESSTDIAKQRQKLAKKLNGWKDVLSDEIAYSGVAANLLELLRNLMPVIKTNSDKRSSNGRLAKLQEALARLHAPEQGKICEPSEQLILPTLGSQEGAFENVRMNYSGDQGQTIRQLVTTHAVRRVVMCCLASSPFSSSAKRQHLAVAHEKGKITVLQLSALLKQADSSQKKLTLTRLASAPVPFTVLSIVPNPSNEDYLAVAGIKDCHILTFNGTNTANNGASSARPGEVTAHLVLHPQLDANNYIIKTVWMPGSQTELALVTADFIKVYSLGEDAMSPQYYFLVPSGKVRDCTLAFMEDGSKYVLIMSSAGHIYFQQLTQESSAGNGPFYVTNIMDVNHPAVKDYPNFSSYDNSSRGQVNNRNEAHSQHCSSEQIGGGGVSIYYSQSLQCLFFSYAKGKNFMAPLSTIAEEIVTVFPIQLKSGTVSATTFGTSTLPTSVASTSSHGGQGNNSGNSNKNSSASNNMSSSNQPLCQWSEVQGHPGLVTAFLQSSNNPVVIMVLPDSLQVQEIKVGSKAKIVDMVAIRHNTSGSQNASEQRTTLILLCEDGSLKIYMAGVGELGTEFWLAPVAHPMASIIQQKPPRKIKKTQKRGGRELEKRSSQLSGLLPNFQIDYYENCSTITDVEFGGADILQVYNVQQIKHRLQTTSLYVANTKPTGFELEISNLDANQVIVGIRVMLGSQDTSRVPSYIEFFGRRLPIGVGGIDGRSNLTRGRWFELPLTREESLAVGGATIGVSGNERQKLVLTFGPSLDPGSVNIVDSVQIYGKTKEVFGWPEDPEDAYSGSGTTNIGASLGAGGNPVISNAIPSQQFLDSSLYPFSLTDRIVTGALEILDGCFAIQAAGSSDESLGKHKTKALELTSQLITISTQTRLEVSCKALLAALFPSPSSYYNHKDQTLLRHVAITFKAFESVENEIDIDTFQRLILITRGK